MFKKIPRNLQYIIIPFNNYLSHDIPFRRSSSFEIVASSLRTLDKPVVSIKSEMG